MAHFIKFEDNRKVEDIETFRDLKLTIDLRGKKTLILINKNKEYKDLIKGFDAAANELHAVPEAFAPIKKSWILQFYISYRRRFYSYNFRY